MPTIICFILAGLIGVFAMYCKARIKEENIKELIKKGVLK